MPILLFWLPPDDRQFLVHFLIRLVSGYFGNLFGFKIFQTFLALKFSTLIPQTPLGTLRPQRPLTLRGSLLLHNVTSQTIITIALSMLHFCSILTMQKMTIERAQCHKKASANIFCLNTGIIRTIRNSWIYNLLQPVLHFTLWTPCKGLREQQRLQYAELSSEEKGA